MNTHIVKIISIDPVTHNVNQYKIEKPAGYTFTPGQATDVSVNSPELKDEKRSFTFTSLNEDSYLEFTIKSYNDHDGVTKAIGKLRAGDELIIGDVWGAIQYKGPGVFIAGGAGVTPFIAILRDLNKKNKIAGNMLIFSNKTADDIILKDEFEEILGDNFINTITDGKSKQYDSRRIDKEYLKEKISSLDQHFYICGPVPMIEAVEADLLMLNAKPEFIVKEDLG
ncbi:hypothetical protein BH10BAC5_BH10BAC5_27160 [soil metagenome]